MANAQRRKGLRGEAEVAAIWRSHGFEVRKLEGSGDLLVSEGHDQIVGSFPHTLHCEVKRENRLRQAWLAQAVRERLEATIPVVPWRPDNWPWWAMLPLEDLARLLA